MHLKCHTLRFTTCVDRRNKTLHLDQSQYVPYLIYSCFHWVCACDHFSERITCICFIIISMICAPVLGPSCHHVCSLHKGGFPLFCSDCVEDKQKASLPISYLSDPKHSFQIADERTQRHMQQTCFSCVSQSHNKLRIETIPYFRKEKSKTSLCINGMQRLMHRH